MSDYPFVRVEWVDSTATADWMAPDAVDKALRCATITTIGWLMLDAPDRIIIASSHDDTWELVGELIAIPRPAIVASSRVVAELRK